MEYLHRRHGAADAEVRPAQQDAREQALGAVAPHHRRGPQRRDRDLGVLRAPVGEHAGHFRSLYGGRELGVGAQHRVLGERHRVVGVRAVDRGVGDAHDAPHPDRGSLLEHVAGAVDVHSRHQLLVGDGVDHAREVHHHVDALQHRA